MNPLADVEPGAMLSGHSDWIGAELQRELAAYPLDCIGTEFPHHAGAVESAGDTVEPSEQHPVFYGCFDWHSAVHSHWCLVRQLRLFEAHPRREAIVSAIDDRLTAENVQGEIAYFEENPAFEKPYGWAWLLRLAAELALWDDHRAEKWREALSPLEERIASLVESDFLTGDRPFRVGTHQNTAFALAGVLDYARVVGDESLAGAARETSAAFFGDDSDYPVEYEPLGWDFLSPALAEADLMRRVRDGAAFREWLDRFFPDLTTAPYAGLLDPIEVARDPDEGVALHLVGTNLAKAWSLAGLAEDLEGHQYRDLFRESAKRHATAGIELAFTDDYAGSHWLSSFVLYLLTRNEGGIGPR
jgi:hypothetical protein